MFVKIFSALLAVFLLLAGCSAPSTQKTHLFTTVVTYSGENESDEKYLEIAQRSQALFSLLEEKAGAFVLDAYNYQALDEEGTPLYTANTLEGPPETAPNGCRLTISKNYFSLNPIETADGKELTEQFVYDDRTMNLLVPEKLRGQEQEIMNNYRDWFYFEKVTAENSYNEMAGREERLNLTEADLDIHIIYVKDGQRYPMLRDDCAVGEGGFITDPIVEIYTGNIHCNYAHSFLSQWTYFPQEEAGEAEAFAFISPYVQQCGVNIQQVKAVEPKGE